MFGKKRPVAVQTQVIDLPKEVQETPAHTVDIIHNSKVSYIDLLDRELTKGEEHLKKYLYTLERKGQDDISPLDMDFITRARKAGFTLFVRPDVIAQFRYAAIIYSIHSHQVNDGENDIIYVGDIPDFALDRILEAQNKKLRSTITIHSNQELAVKYEPYIYRDPVVIAWNYAADIRKEKGIWQCTNKNTNAGCVIAMWGEDGQPL
jgi:hypothetical protein